MKSEIKIKNSKAGTTTIEIEGTIGVPEEWQFEDPAGRVATYEKFRRTLAAISRIRSSEIVVDIRSTGGDAGDALLIYEALTECGATITTRCHGYVASAATIIAQAASEGRREISSSSLYLVHRAVGSCEGNADELRRGEEMLDKTDRRIAGIYAARSGRDTEAFTALMAENNGNGRWLSADEAIAEGLADRIMEQETNATEEQKITNAATVENEQPREESDTETIKLQQRIKTLRHETLQAKAGPTTVKSKEDPSPTESRRSANETAYMRDAEAFQK
jgi:ATP-dependent protease ClpP protease subunit